MTEFLAAFAAIMATVLAIRDVLLRRRMSKLFLDVLDLMKQIHELGELRAISDPIKVAELIRSKRAQL